MTKQFLAVSLYDDSLSERRIRNSTQRIFAAILEDESDGLCEIGTRLGGRTSLTICARDLWRVRDKPVVGAFDDCSELVVHALSILLRCADTTACSRSAGCFRNATASRDAGYGMAMHAAEALDESLGAKDT